MSNTPKLKTRNHFIDVIKGFAIICILITHCKFTDGERNLFLFPFWVEMAVPLFMIISGFVYTKSFESRRITSFKQAYAFDNVFSKFVRYTVPFAIAYVIEVVCFLVMRVEQNYIFLFLRGGEGPGSYYYPVLVQFIFLFPIIFFIVKEYRLRGLMICLAMNVVYELLHTVYGMNEECYRLLVFRYIFVIAFGCYLNYADEETEDTKKLFKKCLMIGSIVGVVFLWLVFYQGYQPIIIKHWIGTSFLANMYLLPIAQFLICKGRVKISILELFGKASYNIFLVQMVYFAFGSYIVHGLIPVRAVYNIIDIVLCLIAGVIFYYVEQPITNQVLKISKNLIR